MVFPYHPSPSRKPRICVLTYKALTGLVLQAEQAFRDRADIAVDEYVLDDAVFRGRQLQQQGQVDVLVSAGYNAAVLRSQVDLPVASIEVTGFDLLNAFKSASGISRRFGLVVYAGSIRELEPVRGLLQVDLEQLSYTTLAEARECVLRLRDQGIQVVVGSSLIVGIAEQLGLRGVLYYTAASVERALEKAVELGENVLRQAARFEQLNTVLSHLHEAILAVDTQHRITALNPLMRRILDLQDRDVIGQRLPDVAQELSLAAVLAGQVDEGPDEVVLALRRGTYLMNRSSLRERGLLTGALITLRETAAIQRADSAIRAQRRTQSRAARHRFDGIAGSSAPLAFARQVAKRCAATHSTVLITGETGTGKELFAQAIHNESARRAGPFVALNCASFPESLLESELFGYEEGAFTGSRKGGKPGLFEAAHTGTVFLDEIGDMPISLQTRLLRVLQEREVVRLGSHQPVQIDVRVIAATHQRLTERIAEGSFRADLYYRLNILHIALPPLRERGADLPLLAAHLLDAKLRELGQAAQGRRLLEPLLPTLLAYRWPGNIRELENLMERFAVFVSGARELGGIDVQQFLLEAPELRASEAPPLQGSIAAEASHPPDAPLSLSGLPSDAAIQEALRRTGGNRQLAAQLLGVSRTTLWRRLREGDA
ncbi:MAG: propionate catabolism operon regulatory protein PrpR [Burkholderiales bacterium]|uniref:propionate catabolism operon regulatory protein PrpR n=1 Tax=Inhella sp. TaxID=1921806 RepID=UPI001AC1FDE8|nr:propionate catabolism operon regulatory protein PrpR [Burkholderiales bacterium]